MPSVALDSPPTPAARPAVLAARGGDFWITTEAARLDLELTRDILALSSPAITLEAVRRAIVQSLPFGVFHGERQIGFARVVTDRATFAYLDDLFVLEPYRGRGLGSWLLGVVVAHPELQGIHRWLLRTRDPRPLYRKHGFVPLAKPEWWMGRVAAHE
jgi:GNAT superfamily N-acetyltransferase